MRLPGLLFIALSVCLPLIWFLDLAAGRDLGALLSQYLGVCALVLMGISQVLATRLPGLEAVFGGLDCIYVLHKWLGVSAMLLVLLHDTIDAEMSGIGRETVITEVAETLGEVSLYGLLVLATLSVATFVPYHLWKYTHKFMGAFFAASALHYIFILKPFNNFDPLGLYVLSFCVIGVIAYAYTLMPVGWLKGWRNYSVSAVERSGDGLKVSLMPDRRGHRHDAGQFAFVRFEMPGYEEIHPFTISKMPDTSGQLRFTIKRLGDYTSALHDHMSIGTKAQISRPFGHFRLVGGNNEQIWIASGIGITPFLAWAQSLKPTDGLRHLFYCVQDRTVASHLDELETIAAQKDNLRLHVVESKLAGRLHPTDVAEVVSGDKRYVSVAFCGPKQMREAFRKELATLGFSPNRFRYEEFEIRSGLGVRRSVNWLVSRFQ